MIKKLCTPSGMCSLPASLSLCELHQVLRVRLRIVIGDEDAGVVLVVHSGVVEVVTLANVRGQRVFDSLAELAHDDAAEEHALHASLVGRAVLSLAAVGRVPGEVDPLAIHGGVPAAEAPVEALLGDLARDLRGRPVEEPDALEARGAGALL